MFFPFAVRTIKKMGLVPKISDTERAALDAGTVWVEGELFSGRPDFKRIMDEAYPSLNAEEQAFLDGPVEELCNMVSPWQLSKEKRLPDDVWAFLRENKFLGLFIPKKYGGHEFTSAGFSAIIGKLGTHSATLNTVVLLANSIGPGELIMHYGNDEQKSQHLPRLASGEDIPCFALTEPNAGSDAGSLTSSGVLFKDEDGELKIRLNWNKRYITLAPIATLLGLAFRLFDPDNLLGKGEDIGITCALVSTKLKGAEVGLRHDPMGSAFPNGPTTGKDVVIKATDIIGGLDYAGRGWQMLMEALSGGRALSLPAGSTYGAKAFTRSVGAYAALRQQFGMSIGKFEGIQEPLARMGGNTYMLEALRTFTCGAVFTGQKPAVVSAIAKYYSTEMARRVVVDGMDILGGKGICRGPKNPFADAYASTPIGITVEGANILTRTLIIFGQGALRCHPYMQTEVKALEADDSSAFRNAFLGHLWHVARNFFLVILYGMTRGFLASSRPISGPLAKYVRKIKWVSAMYAFMADLVVAAQGPKLKQKGKLAGRYADILAHMYLASAVIRRHEAEGKQKDDLIFAEWALQTCFHEIQKGFEGIFQNFEMPFFGFFIRLFGRMAMSINPVGRAPSDELSGKVAAAMMEAGERRDRLTAGVWHPADKNEPLAEIEHAFMLVHECKDLHKSLKKAVRSKTLPKLPLPSLIDKALEQGLITDKDAEKLRECEDARAKVLAVDAFGPEEYFGDSYQAKSEDSAEGSKGQGEEKQELAMASQ